MVTHTHARSRTAVQPSLSSSSNEPDSPGTPLLRPRTRDRNPAWAGVGVIAPPLQSGAGCADVALPVIGNAARSTPHTACTLAIAEKHLLLHDGARGDKLR